MAFLHHATIVTLADHLIVVDLTAQQFAHHRPRRWFDIDATYRARLAKATGAPTSASPQPRARVSRTGVMSVAATHHPQL